MCGLCGHGHFMIGGYVYTAGERIPLCHLDDHSCYHRWTVYGERPEGWPWESITPRVGDK